MSLLGLSPEQDWSFKWEVDHTRDLLRHGEKTLETDPYFESNPAPVLTTLSIGVEKLYKLTIGVSTVVRENRWPDVSLMRDHYRHDILKLYEAVLADIESGQPPPAAASSIHAAKNDPVIPLLLEALTAYAKKGRFYHLDVLAEDPRRADQDPDEIWRKATFTASQDPQVAPTLKAAQNDLGNNALLEEGIQLQGRRISESVRRLWMLVVTSGQTGAWGDRGKRFGSMIQPALGV